jgi:hypothetical protein
MKDVCWLAVVGVLSWLLLVAFQRIAVVSHRVDMVIMIQQSQEIAIDALENN